MLFYTLDGISLTLIFISATLLYLFAKRKKDDVKNLPPGPRAWPIVGNYLEYATDTHVKLAKLKEKYGPIFSGRVGSLKFIVLSSAKAIKEAYNKPEFLGKTPFYGCNSFDHHSVFFSNDIEVWKEQRGFIIRSIRDFGLGKVRIEDEITDEIQRLFRFLENNQKIPIKLVSLLEQSAANNVLAMVVGKRFDYEDKVLTDLVKCIKEYLKNLSKSGIYMTFPWIRYITPILKLLLIDYDDSSGYDNTKKNFRNILEDHKKTFNEEHIRDFFDQYLKEIYQKGRSSKYSEDILLATSMEFIGAGTESTADSVLWCMYMIAAYPDVKRRLFKEIEDVVGLNRTPSMSDQKSMPYTQAFIIEVTRWASIAPMAPIRYTSVDTTLCGYDIPKNTAVLGNLWAVHHDPEIWDEPHIIKPERFLEADGKSMKKLFNYIPFSVGKRKCPGEAMAYMEIFLYVVSILQKFDINFLPGEKATFEIEIVVTCKPKKFPIFISSRTSSMNVAFY